MKTIAILFIGLCISTSSIYASTLPEHTEHLINVFSNKHGTDKKILRRVIMLESSGNPWAFNVHGESFSPKSKQRAIDSLYTINNNPWLVKIKTPHGNKRAFFPTKQNAYKFFRSMASSKHFKFNLEIKCTVQQCKLEKHGDTALRKLNVKSTDIGYAQINYLYHGYDRDDRHWTEWFEPKINIDYAAQLLSKLKKKHGSWDLAVAYYHSRTKHFQKIYIALFNKGWKGKALVLS